MSTREIYFKTMLQTDLPIDCIYYMKKKDNLVSFDKITVSFRKKDYENEINRMGIIEKTDNFLYWTNSIEGQALINSIKFSFV